ncbi:family 16 glycosylhydrolase, partial [bacterium]|nr:family 16 glycosylhydrolase [bacterium]
GWPFCGEIDIMEHVNNELKVHGTIHYDQWGHTYSGDFAWADASIFHVYELEWDSDEIRWYLDGVQFHQEDISSQSLSREEFHTPFFFILNLAIGGNWPGSPDATTQFPATMLVDYVRVFQEANSVEEIFKPELEISAYPNPASDQLIITSQLDIQTFEVFNLQGAKLAYGDGDQINVSNLAVGSYIVEATAVDGSVGRVSFIKE